MKTQTTVFLSIILFVSLCAARGNADRNKNYPDTTTFFPLLSGSYWVYQDTFYTAESFQMAAEGCNCENPIEWKKDSILSCVDSDSGFIIKLHQTRGYADNKLQKRLGKVRKPVYYYYRCFEGKISIYGSVWAALNPTPGDTLPFTGPGNEKMYYKQNGNDSTFQYLIPLDEKETTLCFKRGVGLVGLTSGGDIGHNLIEYRIGNGPIIKKHWLMESPKRK